MARVLSTVFMVKSGQELQVDTGQTRITQWWIIQFSGRLRPVDLPLLYLRIEFLEVIPLSERAKEEKVDKTYIVIRKQLSW